MPKKMILKVIEAQYLNGCQLWLRFNDGEVGIVDLSQELWGTMFEPLRDTELFRALKVDEGLNTVVWPNGADFAPEFLYGLLQDSC